LIKDRWNEKWKVFIKDRLENSPKRLDYIMEYHLDILNFFKDVTFLDADWQDYNRVFDTRFNLSIGYLNHEFVLEGEINYPELLYVRNVTTFEENVSEEFNISAQDEFANMLRIFGVFDMIQDFHKIKQ
jgi:hypothetical protein